MKARELLRVFAPYIRPERKRLFVGVALMLASTATALLRPWPLKYLFDDLLREGRGRDAAGTGALILGVALAFAVIATADGALRAFRRYVLKASGQRVGFRLQTALYGRLQALSLAYHEKSTIGESITRLTRDVDKVQDLSTETLVEAASHALKLGGMAAVMLWLDWRLSLAMLVLIPPLVIAIRRFNRRVRTREQRARGQESVVMSVAQETLGAMRLVKAYGREKHEQRRFQRHALRGARAHVGVSRTEAVFGTVVDALVACGTAGLIWLGASRVLAGDISPGELVVFVSYLREFYDPVSALSKLGGRVSRISVRARKIAELLAEPADVKDLPDAIPAPRFKGAVSFEHVNFGYRKNEPVLEDVSFRVKPGTVVAIVGGSGSGKSTVAALMPRLHDPNSGRVVIDGEDIKRYKIDSLRANIAWVLQTSVLFRASVRHNIAYGRPGATDDEIVAAAKAAHAHEFIEGLPRGYDTRVGERGETLSGGQRQRIAIARAVVRDAPILILDEPVTGLDAESQEAVFDALETLMRGRTTIVITHDLSTIRHADVILVLDRGRLVERGTHDQLLAKGGRYAELAAAAG